MDSTTYRKVFQLFLLVLCFERSVTKRCHFSKGFDSDNRMIGINATRGMFPYFVSISQGVWSEFVMLVQRILPALVAERTRYFIKNYHDLGHLCNGAIITSSWVVSVAHCYYTRRLTKNLVAIAGMGRLDDREKGVVQQVAVAKVVKHKDFDDGKNGNDIAMLKLKGSFLLDNYFVGKIALNQKPPLEMCHIGVVPGWGESLLNPAVKVLQYVNVELVSIKKCGNLILRRARNLTICGLTEPSEIICYGDSGAPLVAETSTILLGIISHLHHHECSVEKDEKTYILFTDIQAHLEWIYSVINGQNPS